MIKHERENIIKCDDIESTSYEEALSQMKVVFVKKEGCFLEFDLISVDCSVANALRRILISEIPTLAIEKVLVYKNSGVMPDETLAHRLGLIPMNADPEEISEDDLVHLKFRLSVKNDQREILGVYSNDIKCVTSPEKSWFKEGVLITRLAQGHEIEMDIFCARGTGKEHAKWSPVCPASYRLMPDIKFHDIYDEEALKLKSLFKEGVIGVREVEGRLKAFVKDPRLDYMSREVLRHKEFEGRVYIGRVPNHFIFRIESVHIDPLVLLRRSISILINRAKQLKRDILSRNK